MLKKYGAKIARFHRKDLFLCQIISNMRKYAILCAAVICAMLSCSRPQPVSQTAVQEIPTDSMLYAKGFGMSRYADSTVISVFNPWQGANDVVYRYTLVPRGTSSLTAMADMSHIPVPARRVVCMSSSYVAFFDALGCTDSIFGVSGANYIYNPSLRSRIEQGEVKDVGYGQALNYELIVDLKPDVLLCFGVGTETLPVIEKLHSLGIPTMLVGEYLENHPLGKSEWIKVMGALMGREAMADSLFDALRLRYEQLVQDIAQQPEHPAVFMNMPYKDVWYSPGTQNYFVQLIRDAGGLYLFDDLSGSRSYPISFERAYSAGMQADVWLCPGSANSLSDIADFDARLKNLQPYKQRRIFNNNNRSTPHGGSDFWESGTMCPDIILRDMAAIFHPRMQAGDKMHYFVQLR